MTAEAQRIAIAEACGYMQPHFTTNGCCVAASYQKGEGSFWGSRGVPDYLHDLNACHEFEKILDKMEDIHEPGVGICSAIEVYEDALLGICDHPIRATAAQRCEAFLKTINKWRGENES